MKDFKVPFAIVSFLLVQGAGAVWWSSQIDGRVRTLEAESLKDVESDNGPVTVPDIFL